MRDTDAERTVSLPMETNVALLGGAADVQDRKKSRPLSRYRRRVRGRVTRALPRIKHLVAVAEMAEAGPDPESSLIYVRFLRDVCDAIVQDCLTTAK